MKKTLREAIAVCIRLNRAQDAYGVTRRRAEARQCVRGATSCPRWASANLKQQVKGLV
ncbi:hypothetical protein [Streptomyces sp. NPDC052042]|uniref:hypothetical protein n=1 Tax=Streptomyces sp. NPDC052042 TaxID=3365683 RepID=UPI0037CF9316